MRERLTSAGRRATSTWGSFTAGQKTVTVVALVVLGIGGYFFATWAAKPTYAPLFSNLAGSDASAIVEKLNAEGVTYELTDGGGTIMVPKDQVYNLRIQMSGEGLPAEADAGYALLDKQGAMTSEFMQQVGYRRALEGELGKTITAINGVNGATVHLALPQKDVFTDDQLKTTASVLVATNPSKPLSQDKVQSIVHLVASSVEGLDPADVTVVGSDGKVLSSTGSEAGGGGADARASQTASYEERLNTSLQKMLETVLGPGKASVQVTADLDFDATETKTQKYVADPAVPPVSEKKETETYVGGNGATTGGILGPDNIQVPGAGANGKGDYEKSVETRNNAVGMVTEVRRSAPGAVRKLSVAVIVDSAAAKIDEAQLQQLVSSAVGLDPTRGDTIAVSSMAFDQSSVESNKDALTEAKQAESNAQLQSWIQTAAIIAAILLLLVIAAISSRRKRKRSKRLSADERAQLEDMQIAIEAARARLAVDGVGGSGAPALEAGSGAPGSTTDDLRIGRQQEIATLVERQPDEVAQLLRGWLADRRG